MNETAFQALDAALPDGGSAKNDQPYVTEEICEHWLENSRWTYYLAIFGYTILVLIALGFIYFRTFVSLLSGEMFLIGLLTVLVTLILSRSLNSYSKNIKLAATDSDWRAMESAFSSLRNAFAVFGSIMLCLALALAYLFGNAIISNFHYLLESI